jgi:hypothetical protein
MRRCGKALLNLQPYESLRSSVRFLQVLFLLNAGLDGFQDTRQPLRAGTKFARRNRSETEQQSMTSFFAGIQSRYWKNFEALPVSRLRNLQIADSRRQPSGRLQPALRWLDVKPVT